MRKCILIILFMLAITAFLSAQNPYLVLTYTAEDNGTYAQLDSIKIMNRSKGCDTVLYWPDTVLILGSQLEVQEPIRKNSSFQLYQNFPNPVKDQTTISMFIPEKNEVSILITDVTGRMIYQSSQVLDKGFHNFYYRPCNTGISIVTTSFKGEFKSVKVMSLNKRRNNPIVEYKGNSPSGSISFIKNSIAQGNFTFSFGDTLLYIGYYYQDYYESGVTDIPETHDTITLQFAHDIPCPGTPTVIYQGQVYNTVQIFNQCWLKENLNVGTMIPGTQNMENNGILEKYCYDNIEDNCSEFGGLYEWDEIMKYRTIESCQGICPLGWHIPTDEEWKILEGTADTEYGIGDPIWDETFERGYDGGIVLKSTTGWDLNGNGVDWYGFSSLPGGSWYSHTYSYAGMGYSSVFWTSSKDNIGDKWARSMSYTPYLYRDGVGSAYSLSVRCLKNEEQVPSIRLTFTAIKDTNYLQLNRIVVMNRTQNQETVLHWPDTIIEIPNDLAYNEEDELLLIGYQDTLESGITYTAVDDDTITFQFAYNIPCLGTPTVTYEGKVYNTVQIFSQCWLRESLNVGLMIDSLDNMQDNSIIEKYCFGNAIDSCAKYGGLYQWDEMMQYTITQSAQGICPSGWHIPSDEEWKVLEGTVDSMYGLGDPEWDIKWDYRGYDAGTNLKSTTVWKGGGSGTNRFGFSGLPGGVRNSVGDFSPIGFYGAYWSSTDGISGKWLRQLHFSSSKIGRASNWENPGFAVRCLKNQ